MGCTQAKPSKPHQNQTHNHQTGQTTKDQPQNTKQQKPNAQNHLNQQNLSNGDSANKENSKCHQNDPLSKQPLNNPTTNKNIKQTDQLLQKNAEKSNYEQNSSLIQGSKESNSNMKNINCNRITKKSYNQQDKKSQYSGLSKQAQEFSKNKQKTNDEKLHRSGHDKQHSTSVNAFLEKSKDFKKPNQPTSKIQQVYLGVESKVQPRTTKNDNSFNQENCSASMTRQKYHDQSMNQQRTPKNPIHHNEKLNQTTHHAHKNSLNESKQLNESMSNSKKPFAHNLFYSQHPTANKKTQQQKQKEQPQSKANLVGRTSAKKNQPIYDEYFDQPQNPIEKSTKSELIYQNNSESLVERVTCPNKAMFVKKNQFYSVVQDKKDFNYKHEEIDPQRILSQKSIKPVNLQSEIKNQKDCLMDQGDQQGAVRVPIETSYHAPSKRTIQGDSKKDVSMASSKAKAKATVNYLKSLETKIAEKMQNENLLRSSESRKSLEDQGNFSIRQGQDQSHKKESKMNTAFFRQSSQKNIQSSVKQNSHHKQQIKQLQRKSQQSVSLRQSQKQQPMIQGQTQLKESKSPKRKVGPIKFSQISFGEKEDSQIVPDEQNQSNGLHMSVYLNVSHGF